jgi:hypothetical protein
LPVVIPELVYIVGLLFLVVGYVVARGLLATWTHSVGYLLEWLAGSLVFSIPLLFGHKTLDLGGPFRSVDRFVVTALQNWCAGAEIAMGYCLHGMEKTARYMAQAVDYLARETTDTFDWLLNVHLPRWLRYTVVAALPAALIAKMIAAAVAHLKPTVVRTVRVIDHAIPARVTHTIERVGPLAIPGALALPGIIHKVGTLWKWRLHVDKRLHKLEVGVGVTAFAAAMANVLGLPNWRCLTRGNIGRGARAFCGLDRAFLDLLLLGVGEALVVSDLCTFAGLMSDATEAIVPELTAFVAVEDALIGCHGATQLKPWSLPALDLPTSQSTLSLGY